jgi:hypothetical protein
MRLQGVQRPSAKINDIGFEYSYYKDQPATQELCCATAAGTVVKVEPAFDVDPSGGASFQKRNKMLIDGEADAKVKVTPVGVVTPQWSTDIHSACSVRRSPFKRTTMLAWCPHRQEARAMFGSLSLESPPTPRVTTSKRPIP